MKNKMKKLAAALLSGTMLLGMTGSVFAADAQTDAMSVSVTANDTSAVLTKTWTAAENGLLKDGEEFTFQLTYDSVGGSFNQRTCSSTVYESAYE